MRQPGLLRQSGEGAGYPVGFERLTVVVDKDQSVAVEGPAGGEAVFCFYVLSEGTTDKPAYAIYYRRWKAGVWGPPIKVATESVPLNELAAPTVSPPSYAAILWDQLGTTDKVVTWVKFARVPNR